MNRKDFLKSSGVGVGLALIPNIMFGLANRSNNSEAKIVKDDEGDILNVIGDIQTHKLGGSDTDNQIVEWVSNVEPGVGIPPHVHTKEDEIFRVVKGQVEIIVNGKSSILREGDIAFAPKHFVHSWKVIGNEKAKMITSAFPAGIDVMFKELSELPAGPPDFKEVARICEKQGIRFV